MGNESDFSAWSDDSELLDVWVGMVVVLVEFCCWLLVFWTLWLVQARSTMRVNISVMCFIW